MNKAISISEWLTSASQTLAEVSESPRLDCELLLAHTLKKNRTYLATWPEKTLNIQDLEQLKIDLARRQQGEPIAYILGSQHFWDLELKVTPDTLIPRADTETLIEIALQIIPSDAHWNIADLGTGTGAIALCLAKERPHCKLIATDISASALDIAKQNATQHHIQNIEFRQGDWFNALDKNLKLNMIVSNPPYIDEDDPAVEPHVKKYEPNTALFAKGNGLADLQTICETASTKLLDDGWLLLEHGWQQAQHVADLLQQNQFFETNTSKDYAGHDRVTYGKLTTSTRKASRNPVN